MRPCPLKTLVALLVVTALLTLDASTISAIAGLLPIAIAAWAAFGSGRHRLDAAIGWLRRRLRPARAALAAAVATATDARLLPAGIAPGPVTTRGPPA